MQKVPEKLKNLSVRRSVLHLRIAIAIAGVLRDILASFRGNRSDFGDVCSRAQELGGNWFSQRDALAQSLRCAAPGGLRGHRLRDCDSDMHSASPIGLLAHSTDNDAR